MKKDELNKLLMQYQVFSMEADGISVKTLESRMYSLDIFLSHSPDLKKLSPEKAKSFKVFLKDTKNKGRMFSMKRQRRILANVRNFLLWLSLQTGYRRAIPRDLISYFSLSNRDNKLANIRARRDFPSLDHVIRLVNAVSSETVISRMYQALIAVLTLYGIRNSAIRTVTLGNVDPYTLEIHQSPLTGVQTKFTEDIHTFIMPFDSSLVDIVKNWLKECNEMGFGRLDPLFPKLSIKRDKAGVIQKPTELTKEFIRSKHTLNQILKQCANEAELPYYSAHQFRHLCVFCALRAARNAQELKAICTQFGHKTINLVMSTYGNMSYSQQREIIAGMKFEHPENNFGIN